LASKAIEWARTDNLSNNHFSEQKDPVGIIFMQSFRFLSASELQGLDHMAIDEAMLRHAEESSGPTTTLRLYRWDPPAVSLGYAQTIEKAADISYCRQQGIDIVRRPTGGRAVLHDMELTYAVVSNELDSFGGGEILDCYLVIARALHQALSGIGCPAEISSGNLQRKGTSNPFLDAPCFLSTSRYEITVAGRKLIGSAQRRLKRSFLQHGSILLRCDYNRQAAALAAENTNLSNSFVGVEEFVQDHCLERNLRQRLVQGFEEVLLAVAQEGNLKPEEIALWQHYRQTGRHLVI
jgi:lipoyl(octanoyl) transferase